MPGSTDGPFLGRPQSASERAIELCTKLWQDPHHEQAKSIPIITAAIQSAERDTANRIWEEAAKIGRDYLSEIASGNHYRMHATAWNGGALAVIERIEAKISKE